MTDLTASFSERLRALRRFGAISHPHVVRLDELREIDQSRIMIVMEFVAGRRLEPAIDAARMPARDRLQVILDLLDGLQALHETGVVHGDVRPGNIRLRERNDSCVLLDFSLPSMADDQGMLLPADVSYIAPEQLRGEAATPRTDIYSAGAIAYALLCGAPPFTGDTAIATLLKVSADPAPPLRGPFAPAAEAFTPIIGRALEKQPAARFESALEMKRALQAVVDANIRAITHHEAASDALVTPRLVQSPPAAPAFDAPSAASLEPYQLDALIAHGRSGDLYRANDTRLERPVAIRIVREPADSTYASLMAPVTMQIEPSAPAADPAGPLQYDENVQFTVYRPSTVQPARWYSMLAFAHLSERRADAPAAEPDPVAEVQRQAQQALGADLERFEARTQDAANAVPREGELRFVPVMAGVEFNPPERTFLWTESVHREEFRLRAGADLNGRIARGHLTVYLGRIVLADVTLAIRVDANAGAVDTPPLEAAQARPYRNIFASYSHQDADVVREFERHAVGMGDRYLRDVVDLRSGEVWNDRLREMIEHADVFQLFWSRHAMQSRFVREEWEHALQLSRPNFVRPIYWEEPFPEAPNLPPPALRDLHFVLIRGIQATAPPLVVASARTDPPTARMAVPRATEDTAVMPRPAAAEFSAEAVLTRSAPAPTAAFPMPASAAPADDPPASMRASGRGRVIAFVGGIAAMLVAAVFVGNLLRSGALKPAASMASAADSQPSPAAMVAAPAAPEPAAASASVPAAAPASATETPPTAVLPNPAAAAPPPTSPVAAAPATNPAAVAAAANTSAPTTVPPAAVTQLPATPPPTPPPAATAADPPGAIPPAATTQVLNVPVRVGGDIPAPARVAYTEPVRPPRAVNAHIAGTVVVDITIDAGGDVIDAKILKSIPLLDDAAIDTVKTWQFAPTMIQGRRVPVILTVDVVFRRD